MTEDHTEQSSTIRKVYVLPVELADRIAKFQRDKNLPSEVEAVRRLLDEALLTRDNGRSIVLRVQSRLKSDGMVINAAKDILVGHPLVKEISFPSSDCVTFTLKDESSYLIKDNGEAEEWDPAIHDWEPLIPF